MTKEKYLKTAKPDILINIDQIVRNAIAEAYKRGWDDALDAKLKDKK